MVDSHLAPAGVPVERLLRTPAREVPRGKDRLRLGGAVAAGLARGGLGPGGAAAGCPPGRGGSGPLDRCGGLPGRLGPPAGSALGGDDPGRFRRGVSDPRLRRGLHARRSRLPPLLHLSEPVHLLDADAGSRQQLPPPLRVLGGGGALLLSVDRLLVRAAGGRRGGEKGIHRQPGRGLRIRPGRDASLDHARHGSVCGGLRGGPGPAGGGRRARHRHHAALVPGGHREVGAASPLRLAARRDGGPHAGLGPDPRRDHGDGGGLHGGPLRPALQSCPAHDGGGGVDRRAHGGLRRHHRPGPDRHQAGRGLLDDLAARLYVPGMRGGGLRGGDLSSDDPCLLQGASLPRGGVGHPRPLGRAGPPQDGRAPAPDADHRLDLPGGGAGKCRHLSPGRVLVQGRDPLRGVRRGKHCPLGARRRRSGPHRSLHASLLLPGVRRAVPRAVARASRARVAGRHVGPPGDLGNLRDRGGVRRFPAGARGVPPICRGGLCLARRGGGACGPSRGNWWPWTSSRF